MDKWNKTILNSVGRTDIWLKQNDLHGTNRRISIKQVLIDQFQQTWRAQMLQSYKGRMYLNYKDNLELEPYFKILNQNECITIFKFRTSNHNMPIEVGRWCGTLGENRKCTLCTQDALGSEQHYLLSCNQFTTDRTKWLPSSSNN